MSKLESVIESEIRLYIISVGGNFHKLDASLEPSIPDRIVLFPGCPPVYLEIKQTNGRVRAGQEKKIQSLQKEGYRTHIVRSLDDVVYILNSYFDIAEYIQNYEPVREKGIGKYKVNKR